MNITTTVEGLERYPVNLRYSRELRDNLPRLREVLVPTPAGPQIPLGQLADFHYSLGPPAIKSENARPNAWIYVDIRTSDIGGYVEAARAVVDAECRAAAGLHHGVDRPVRVHAARPAPADLRHPAHAAAHLRHHLSQPRLAGQDRLVLAGVPFALIGAIWLLYLLDYNLSIAVWVGMIALAGLYAETAIVLLLYLDVSYGIRGARTDAEPQRPAAVHPRRRRQARAPDADDHRHRHRSACSRSCGARARAPT